MFATGFPSQERPRFAVDAHVHFHQQRLVAATLDAAVENFSRAGLSAARFAGALLLAQSSSEHVFEELAGGTSCGRWQLHAAASESQTMLASNGERQIAIICGRQVRCAHRLEALALGTTASYPDGCDLSEILDRIRSDGALAVVPWGFGKWTGRAARVIRELFNTASPESLFAGDNGGRMQAWGMPKLLQVASRVGIRVLPGTDPFPFGADYRRVGAFGFVAAIAPDPSEPWRSLKRWLEDAGGVPEPYGRALNPLHFAVNQGWIQVHNRVMPGAAR
jgi:hypothetical protein